MEVMTKPPQTRSDAPFDPKRVEEIVARIQAEGRMPSSEQLSEVLQEHRKVYQRRIREIRDR
jgi:hypothetical protein